jgi:serine O-acetyltransferase
MFVVRLHRLSHWLWRKGVPLIPWLIKVFCRIVFGVVLPPSVRLGNGVILSYEGLGTVLHHDAVVGNGAIIGSGVTLGGRAGHAVVPTIGEGALVGTGAKVLGPVRVGRFASIGANAVVLSDVPDYGVAVGVPARVVKINRPEDLPNYRDF